MRKLLITCLTIGLAMTLTACNAESDETTSERGARVQESIMQKAQSSVPVPQTNNFLTRKAVAKWMERMDQPQKLFYIYVLADTGNVIGYYVAQTRPVSECALMTAPKRLERGDRGSYGGDFQMPAPALDGVYYTGGCDSGEAFFFDAETDAFIGLSGLNYFVADQPLSLDADPIKIQ